MEKEPHKPVWQDVAPSNDTVKKHCQRWDLLVVENDILYYKWESEDGRDFTLKLGVPKELQTLVTVTQQLHNSVTSGHLGIKKTLSKFQSRYFWYLLRNDVKKWCTKCDICVSKKNPPEKYKAPLIAFNVDAPFERIALDI